ncbi:MAG: 30S ribosomal protein S8 [Thermodesulfobacteriota bacterium]
MTMTDPVADMLTRVRNAVQAHHDELTLSSSKLKLEVARILKEEGYIKDFSLGREGKFPTMKIKLKYASGSDSVITKIERVSKPGLRKYVGKDDVPRVLNGLGIAIISTSRGLMTDTQAREAGVGGEVICRVY